MIDIESITNTIINDDCMNILKQLPDKCIDLVLTDPPYLHESGGRGKFLLGDSLDREKYNMGELSDFGKDQIYNFLNASKRINKKINGIYFVVKSKLYIIYLGVLKII